MYYKRNLPHFQPLGYTYFITIRLYGSLPAEVIKKLKTEYASGYKKLSELNKNEVRGEEYQKLKRKYFRQYDHYLDSAGKGPLWLKNKKTASVIVNTLLKGDKTVYDLIAYCIMSNHVHIVLTPIVERDSSRLAPKLIEYPGAEVQNEEKSMLYPVTEILRKIKGSTSRECNKILGRTGAFWQHESYDHVVRNSESLNKIVNYVLNNPVKAGLVATPEEWEWSYVNWDLL